MRPAQRFGRTGEIAGIGDTEYSAILGWHETMSKRRVKRAPQART